MMGDSFSFSQRCGIIKFIDGPYDGQSGLYDHNNFDSIAFSHFDEKCSYSYKPLNKGHSWYYIFSGAHPWRTDDISSHQE